MTNKNYSYRNPLPSPEEIRAASNNGIMNAVCKYAYKLGKQDWHYISFKWTAPYTHKCPICSDRLKGERYGSNCICVPFACWHHGGHIPCHCNTHVINDSNWERISELPDYKKALAIARRRTGVRDIMLIRGEEVMSSLCKGDICAHFNGDQYIHSSLYLGKGKMIDCSLEKMHIAVRDAMDCRFAIRYTGGRDYLSLGDSGTAVKKVQEYLNWYFADDLNRAELKKDGRYGRRTREAVIHFQSLNNIKTDGKTGRRTLEAMRRNS